MVRDDLSALEPKVAQIERDLGGTELHVTYETSHVLRRTVRRVVGWNLMAELAPVAVDVLAPRSRAIGALLDSGVLDCVKGGDATAVLPHGTIGRRCYGDDARLLVALNYLLEGPVEATIDICPPGLRAMNSATTKAVMASAKALHIKETRDWPWTKAQLRRPFDVDGPEDRRTDSERIHVDEAFNMSPRLSSMFTRNAPGQAELLAACASDFYRAHDLAGSPETERLSTSLHSLHLLKWLSHLKNGFEGRLAFKDRYVQKPSEDPGAPAPARRSMCRVEFSAGDWRVLGNRAPMCPSRTGGYPLDDPLRSGDCPGSDPLKWAHATEYQLERMNAFVAAVWSVTLDERFPHYLMTKGVSEPDVYGTIALGLTDQFLRRGIVTLDQAELARHLRPRQSFDGMLSWSESP